MVNSKTIATVAVSVVLSLLGSLALVGQGPSGPQGLRGQDGKDGEFGALAGPDIASPFISWGGVRQWAWSPALASATTTVCSVQAPAATSTLIHASVVTLSQPYANTYEIGIANNTGATTTRVAIRTLSLTTSLDYLSAAATTSATSINNPDTVGNPSGIEGAINEVVGPHQFVNVRIATTTASATFAPEGHCNILFREL